MTEPPAELPEIEQESGRKRSGEPHDADRDEQVGAALREAERAQRAPEQNRVEGQPRREDDPRCGAPRLRHGRHEAGLDDRCDAQHEDEDHAEAEQPEQRAHGGRAAKSGERAERKNRAAHREGRATGERRDADVVDEHVRRRQPVETEKRRHHRERTADEDGVAVTLSRAGDGQRDRCHRGDACAERDAAEVDPAVDQHLVAPDEVQERCRDDRGERGQREQRDAPSAHESAYRHSSTGLEPRHLAERRRWEVQTLADYAA